VPDPHPVHVDVSVVVWVREDARPAPMLTGLLAALDHAERGGAGAALPSAPASSGPRGERLHGEVVLVADLSAEAATGLLAGCVDPRVRVVRAPGAGRGRARDLGAAAADGRYLLFTDDDVRVPEHWVAAMVAPLRAGHADLVAGAVRLAPHLHRPWLTAGILSACLDVVPDPPVVGRGLAGASLGASRAVLEQVGFDEALGRGRYPGGDDVVFRHDVVAAGFREHAVPGAEVERWPDALVVHPRRLAAQARVHGRCAAYLDRHRRGVRPAVPATLLRIAGRAAEVALRALVPGPPREPALRAGAALAYQRELLHLRSVVRRAAPRGAVRGVPVDPAGPRRAAAAARPEGPRPVGGRRTAQVVPLVSRTAVAPTVLPPLAPPPGTVTRTPGPDDVARGAIEEFWAPDRLRRVSAFPVEGRTALRRASGT
jgi:GT2 family glycosyltransferase